MQEPEESDARGESEAKQVEFQLRGRHLTLAVVALALFGAVLFLLGRWSERVAGPEGPPGEGIEESPLTGARSEPDPAAPRELTFYETLGKKTPVGFQAASKTAARKEPPAVLPGSTRVPAPPAAKPAAAGAPKPKDPAAAAAPAPSAAGTERFRVQVASTRDAAAARQLVERLRKKGYAANLETAQGPDGKNQYKVRVGNYSERGPAEDVAARIRSEEKVGAWIVKVQG
jgi:cell division septation protein DedD